MTNQYINSTKCFEVLNLHLEDLRETQIETCKLVIALSSLSEAPTKEILEYLNEKIQYLQKSIAQMEKHLKYSKDLYFITTPPLGL